ncbi:hypothetical protein HN827_03065, partial [archaeon]|nr:hypothetical protein [archaeon]
ATIINVIADRNGEGESVISCDSPPKGTENDEVDIVVIRNGASRLSRMFSEAKFKYTETLTDDNKKEIIDALNDAWNAAKRIIDDKTIENDQRIRADVIKKEVEIYQDERLLIKKEIQTLSNFITEFKKSHMNKDGGFIHHENNTSVSNDSSVNALRQQITFLNGQYTSISNFFSMQEKYEDIIDDKIDPALIHVIQQLKLELDRLRKEINKVDNEIRKIKNLNNDDLATFISEIEQSILQIKNDIKDFENVERRFKITQYRTDFRKHKKQMKNLQREEKLVIDYVSRIQSFHQLATDFINKHNANNFADGEKDRLHSAAEANLIQIKNDLTAMMKLLVDADKKIFEPAEETFKKLERGVGAEITEYYKLKEHGTTLQTKLKDAYGELDEVTPAP